MKLAPAFAVLAAVLPIVACAVDDDGSAEADQDLKAKCEVKTTHIDLACPAVYAPVCGCNGKTYGNACEASREVSSSTKGACTNGSDAGAACTPVTTHIDLLCPAVYAPVCGCDGKTYSNACEASREISSSTPGACDSGDAGGACTPVTTHIDLLCPTVYAPVCGCDGKTYANACEASREISSSTKGPCPTGSDAGGACTPVTTHIDLLCPTVYAPVCGCDGKTYGNACEASRKVSSSTKGPCPIGGDAGVACKRSVPKTMSCAAVYAPVCGCDGKTYGNACEASRELSSWSPDACK